jgi:hypothetical protein
MLVAVWGKGVGFVCENRLDEGGRRGTYIDVTDCNERVRR